MMYVFYRIYNMYIYIYDYMSIYACILKIKTKVRIDSSPNLLWPVDGSLNLDTVWQWNSMGSSL